MRLPRFLKFEQDPSLTYKTVSQHHLRSSIVGAGLLLLAFIVTCFLIYTHFFPREKMSFEDDRHIGSLYIKYPRGEIFDRNGIVLATNTTVPTLQVDPRLVENEEILAAFLSPYLNMSIEELMPRLAKFDAQGGERKMNTIKRWLTHLSQEDLNHILAQSKGLSIAEDPLRFYPHKDSASHLLGFVNRMGEASEGLELAFDEYLHPRIGEIKARKDHKRRLLPSSLLSYQEPEGGDRVQITVDINMQHTLERCLDTRMEEVGAKAAMGILMDPHSGAILALANRPAFDPNRYGDFDPELRKNRVALDGFEPGSAFKIVVTSAALETHLVYPEEMIDCENGGFNPYGHYIKDFYNLGVIPFSYAFAKSSNVAMIKLGKRLGPERMDEWIRLYGFGKRCSPDFKHEGTGIHHAREKWSRLTMGSLPMGQEINVTMLQLARAFAVIANGGFLVEPYFVEQAVNIYGEPTYSHTPEPPVRILSPDTANTMVELSHRVVLEGTGTTANIPEFRVGGKTGTAQIARTDGRGYYKDRYTAVFAGFAPISSPSVVAVIVVQEPSIRQRWGGFVCGPVFKEVVKDALIRLGVPEDPVVNPDNPSMEPVRKTAEKEEDRSREKASEEAILLAAMAEEEDADTISPPPDPADIDDNLDALLLSLDGTSLITRPMAEKGDEKAMPDLLGKTKSQVRMELQRLGIVLDAQGVGWAVEQEFPPGLSTEGVKVCSILFADKISQVSQEETDDTG
jgi:cell division protein FtsI/penicillin-binding protein 2